MLTAKMNSEDVNRQSQVLAAFVSLYSRADTCQQLAVQLWSWCRQWQNIVMQAAESAHTRHVIHAGSLRAAAPPWQHRLT